MLARKRAGRGNALPEQRLNIYGQVTMPSDHGTNSLSPRPSSSLRVRLPEATSRISRRYPRPVRRRYRRHPPPPPVDVHVVSQFLEHRRIAGELDRRHWLAPNIGRDRW